MKLKNTLKCLKQGLALSLMVIVTALSISEAAFAHGERNQEPFLRTRTLHWYDMKYTVENDGAVAINDIVTITGKFRMFERWPSQIPEPERMYLNVNSNGSTFVKLESWVNGKPAIQSMIGELGRDYEFKIVLKARWEGRWHVHPMINVLDTGGLAGPGIWINVTGDHNDFKMAGTTLEGDVFENLSTYGMAQVYGWHIFWAVLGLFWLLYWITKPTLMPRWLMVKSGEYENTLITRTDTKVGVVMLVLVVGFVVGGGLYTTSKHPRTIPLQAGVAHINPLPVAPSIKVDVVKGNYYVPGRTVITEVVITNTTDLPIQLGEYTAANIRFIEHSVIDFDEVSQTTPAELLAQSSLKLSDNSPLNPGESRQVTIEASDAAWELERLTSLMNDPDNTLGALLFFYDSAGNRYITELFSGMVPVFDPT
ncbi:MAG: methane monooxygenase/ammonia monooxygenase subunit B [Proteobacteria bacterium]|nr:methane monooxygenase/ammonia monooxygenase subunit B [Pseudomonadota bacterium]